MWWVAGSFLLISIVSVGAVLYLRRRHQRQAEEEAQNPRLPKESSFRFLASKPAPLRIGILTPVANRTPDLLEQGLLQQLKTGSSRTYTITKAHGNNDRVALFSEASALLSNNDIVVTFGFTCTNIAFEAAAQIRSTTPIVFTGVKQGHLPLLRKKNPNQVLRGLVCQRNYLTQINTLKIIKPAIRHVLILYHQQARWQYDEVHDFATFFHSNGIKATTHMLPQVTQMASQIDALKCSMDTIMVMPHTLNAKAVGDLVNYANQHSITLCVSELDAVLLGAAIGFGNEELHEGVQLGRLIRDITEVTQRSVADVIIDHAEQYQVKLNTRALAAQNILLDDDFIFLLNRGAIGAPHHTQSSTLREKS
ncbi:MAG: ABC transporter substrate binding protein [Candidatus Dependentiae bacterium]|jgi:ABC-type uncharacterized transport system substrate-binding protein